MSSYSLVLPQVRSVRGFWPHPLLPSGHLQTLAASLLPAPKITYAAKPLPVDLGDGDTVVLHDDRPAGWRESAPAVLLVHGLCGSHAAPYMVRMSHLLNRRGCRTFRLDMRGCGASRDLCQEASHAGRSGDLLVALKQIASMCPHSPLQLIGVSLGGNQVLKLLGELCHRTDAANPVTCADDLKVLKRIQRAAVVAPPVDLTRCTDNLERWSMQPYSRYFIRRLLRQVPPRTLKHPAWRGIRLDPFPRTMREFDDRVTAPLCGFKDAADYYTQAASYPWLAQIRVPTLVLSAKDDPLIPSRMIQDAPWSSSTQVEMTRRGGHVGYIGWNPQGAWLEQRVVEYLMR